MLRSPPQLFWSEIFRSPRLKQGGAATMLSLGSFWLPLIALAPTFLSNVFQQNLIVGVEYISELLLKFNLYRCLLFISLITAKVGLQVNENGNNFSCCLSDINSALSGLRKLLTIESYLKMMKNAFCFTFKALFVLKIFKFLSWLFGHVEKRKNGLIRKIRLISKFLMSESG